MSKRKSVKKVVLFFLVSYFFLSVSVGCQQNAIHNNRDSKAEDSKKEPYQQQKLITFAHKSINSYFYIILHESLKRSVEERGWKFESSVADYDPVKQNNQFINFIAKKPSAIISNSIDSERLIDAIGKADAVGIPVGIVDTPTAGGNVAVTVSFDNYVAGQMAAEEIVKRLEKKYGEPKGIVFNAYGLETSIAWRLRKEGFEEVIKKYPGITYIARPGEGDYAKVRDALLDVINKYPQIDAVHCSSDHPGRGLAEALQKKGMWKKVGHPDHVIYVTIDGEPGTVENIKQNYNDASIVQDAVSYGPIMIELMEKYTFNGLEIPVGTYRNSKYFWEEAIIKESPSGPYVVVPPYVMDQSNYWDSRHWAHVAENDWGFKYK